jgi:hypothetical protein
MPTDADDVRLWGLPGAEYMHFDYGSLYESEIEPYGEFDPPKPDTKVEIEEWSVKPARDHMPSSLGVVEWLQEWVEENGEIAGDFDITFDFLAVRKAADALLDEAARHVTWRMADKKLATHWVTWDEQGEPLLDGEPMYVKAPYSDGSPDAS